MTARPLSKRERRHLLRPPVIKPAKPKGPKIVTEFIAPPSMTNNNDWRAFYEDEGNDGPEERFGFGATEQDAIHELKEKVSERKMMPDNPLTIYDGNALEGWIHFPNATEAQIKAALQTKAGRRRLRQAQRAVVKRDGYGDPDEWGIFGSDTKGAP